MSGSEMPQPEPVVLAPFVVTGGRWMPAKGISPLPWLPCGAGWLGGTWLPVAVGLQPCGHGQQLLRWGLRAAQTY